MKTKYLILLIVGIIFISSCAQVDEEIGQHPEEYTFPVTDQVEEIVEEKPPDNTEEEYRPPLVRTTQPPTVPNSVKTPFYSEGGISFEHYWAQDPLSSLSGDESEILVYNEANSQVVFELPSMDYLIEGRAQSITSGTWEKFPSRSSWDRIEQINITKGHYQNEPLVLESGEKGKIYFHYGFFEPPKISLQKTQSVNINITFLHNGQTSMIEQTLQRDDSSTSQPYSNETSQEHESASQNISTEDVCANALGNGDQIISGPSEPEGSDRDNPFRSLTVHPTNPNYILVGTERNGFLRSLDGGSTWERLRYGLRSGDVGYPEIYDIAIAESNPDVIYAATVSGSGPLDRSNAGVYKSTDGGETWARKNCGIQDNGGGTTAVYVDPTDFNHALIAISGGETSYFTADQPAGIYIDGGVYETVNGGEQWTRLNVALNDAKNGIYYLRIPASKPNSLYLKGTTFNDDLDIGLLKSADKGKTWQQIAPTIRNKMAGSFDISADGTTMYTHSDNFLIYKSTDSGATWTSHDVIRTSGYTMTVSPVDSNRVIFGQTNGLFLSTNGLADVTKVLDIDESAGQISDLVFAPSDPSIVYMITNGYILYKSANSGASFSKIGNLREDVLNKNL